MRQSSDMELLQQLVTTNRYRLATECTRKYQEIVKSLPPELLLQREPVDWKTPTASILHAYIDLCAEELLLYKAGEIPEPIWKSWKEGILAGFQIPAVASLWKNFFTGGPYDDLRKFLEENGLPK